MSFIHNSMFGQTVPTTAPTPAQLANAPHSQAAMAVAQNAQGMTQQQLLSHAQNQFNNAYSQHSGPNLQAISAQQYASMLNAQQTPRMHYMWVWNGVPMDVVDFAKHAYGDTPEATHFILKYKEIA